MYQHISPREELIRQAKELRKSVYKIDETMHDKMPKKRESSGLLEDQIGYTKELVELLKEAARFTTIPNIKEKINLLEETMCDTEYEIEYSKDKDAKIGHKTADTSFFGYNTANACGKNGITIQGASAIFLANIKRIIKLKEEKLQNNG